MKKLTLRNYSVCIEEEKGLILSIQEAEQELALRGSFWKIERTQACPLTIADMEQFTYELRGEDRLVLTWKKEAFRVCVTFREEEQKLKMHIFAGGGEEKLERIHFPVYGGIERISEAEDELILPWQNGFLIRNPIDTLLNTENEVPFWMGRGGKKYENDYPAQYSYQFFAYYQKAVKGYYMACEDGKAYTKTIGLHYSEEVNGMDMVFTNYPEGMGEVSYYSLPYSYAFCFFTGDWQTAAKIYREWAMQQKWYTPLGDRRLPQAVKEIDFFRINHEHYALGTRSEEYIETCRLIRDRLNCVPAMHWYGWNKAPKHGDWYPEMADYSNQAWHEELLGINHRLAEMGVKKIPYVNVHLWDKFLPSFEAEEAAESLVVKEAKVVEDEPWSADRNLFAVCHADPKIKEKALKLFDRLLQEDGFDGIYIDQVASFNATLCFHKGHGHPVGGGSWWADEYHNLLETLRSMMPEGKFLTTESCCECYHDVFDLFLILDTCSQGKMFDHLCGAGNSKSIPLFAMIYNDSAVSYGSVCTFENQTPQFEFNFIRNILWGMVPTCEGMELREIKNDTEKWEIIRRGVDFYRKHREVLLFGTYEEYFETEACRKTIAFREALIDCPGVIASVYSYQGETYVYAYNYTEEVQRITVRGRELSVEPGSFACDREV